MRHVPLYDLASLSAIIIRPIYPLSTPFDETSTTGRTSQVSLTDRHHSYKPLTDIDEEESTANETLNVTGKASEGSVEEVSSAIANACTLHELIIIMCACKITKTFWLKFSSIAGPLKHVS